MFRLFGKKKTKSPRLERLIRSDYGRIHDEAAEQIHIAAIFRNEAPYLAEWIEYHLMIGADRIILYDNESTDDYRDAIEPHLASGTVTVIPWGDFVDNISIQPLAYRHALINFGRQARWMAFIDLDEFIVPQPGSDLRRVLSGLQEDTTGIYVPMVDFDHDGHVEPPEGLVTMNYHHSHHAGLSDRVKPILRPGKVRKMKLHRAETEGSTFDISALPDKSEWPLRLNHYFSKSLSEYSAKKRRGWPKGAFEDNIRKDAILRGIADHGVRDDAIGPFLPELCRRLNKRRKAG